MPNRNQPQVINEEVVVNIIDNAPIVGEQNVVDELRDIFDGPPQIEEMPHRVHDPGVAHRAMERMWNELRPQLQNNAPQPVVDPGPAPGGFVQFNGNAFGPLNAANDIGNAGVDFNAMAREDADRRVREAQARMERDRVIRGLGRPAQRRRGAAVIVDNGRAIPRDVANPQPPPGHMPQPVLRKAVIGKSAVVPKHDYPEDGVLYMGHRFSRSLSAVENSYFLNYGYKEVLRKFKDLKFVEKEKPVNESEEVIITIAEIADWYATEDCKRNILGFDIKEHNDEYQIAYKKHVKTIAGFKRNKNG